nr:retrovirus-related Pol polyprotein from transposon TNT 1-94 [Tanacetum cinerariifolium]
MITAEYLGFIHLKSKSDAFDTFKRFKAFVKKQSKCSIKVLRTDNGGEFCSKVFDTFYPTDYDEAAKNQVWQEAMLTEIKAIEKNLTWELKHQAFLVANGYSQEQGIDYEEAFSPITRFEIKQETPAFSSSEAEYEAITSAARQALWLSKLVDFDCERKGATKIFYDNRSAISMAKNPAFHARTKHIDMQHHFIRHLVADNRIELKFCGTIPLEVASEAMRETTTYADTVAKIEETVKFYTPKLKEHGMKPENRKSNGVMSVIKDEGGKFDDNLDEINLDLIKEFVIWVLEGRDVSDEKSCEVFSVMPWVAEGKRVLRKKSVGCSSERRDCAPCEALVFPFLNPGPGSFAHKRIWDPRINISSRQHLEGK